MNDEKIFEEFEKLKDMQQELNAMQELKADEDVIKSQLTKISNQEVKIERLLKTVSNN